MKCKECEQLKSEGYITPNCISVKDGKCCCLHSGITFVNDWCDKCKEYDEYRSGQYE